MAAEPNEAARAEPTAVITSARAVKRAPEKALRRPPYPALPSRFGSNNTLRFSLRPNELTAD